MPEAGAALAALAGGWLPGCAVAWADPARAYPLLPGEDVTGMVPKRAAEFSAGRHAARLALGAAVAIPKGEDRAPVWPRGVAGSITHAGGVCLAAVSHERRGIGLDLEPLRALGPELTALIQNEDDRMEDAGDPGLWLFCAKEAVYKAQYPLTRRILGPEALAVTIRGGHLTARSREPSAQGGQIAGRIGVCAGYVLAVAWL
ncbi:4'-phosphopantetheinyl transferase family protein [Pseudogemmobacter humi]|nr:4'-phosphopantetheinyl transferase superfamily protein [Pseudogemmobacter humi]